MPWLRKQASTLLQTDAEHVIRMIFKRAYNCNLNIKLSRIEKDVNSRAGWMNDTTVSKLGRSNIEEYYAEDYDCLKYLSQIKENQ